MVGRAKRLARKAKRESRTVKPAKLKAVDELAELISRYPVMAILNMHKLPTAALQRIKHALGGRAAIKITRKSTLCFALAKLGDRARLVEYVGAQPAILLTNTEPFRLYKFLAANKSPARAKVGDIAQQDIEVKAGPTDLAPGPIISTLTKVGIPARIEAGKITIMRDKTVLRAGETVSPELAAALQLLKLEPMQIGLDAVAVWEAGTVWTRDMLAVDEAKLLADIKLAASQAINLAVSAGWPTAQTLAIMIAKAITNARTLGLEAKILDRSIIQDLLALAVMQAKSIVTQTKWR